jgi:hypothetical protein
MKEFLTHDVYLASGLVLLLAIVPRYQVQNGRTVFVFPASDDLYRALNDFNAGALLNAIEYSQVIKRLRGEMLSRRSLEASR